MLQNTERCHTLIAYVSHIQAEKKKMDHKLQHYPVDNKERETNEACFEKIENKSQMK